jgi:Bifunctional DNA primase/polymerase, N-terminal
VTVEWKDQVAVAVHLAQLDREDDEREVRLAQPGALLAAALWYAQQSIAVFPLLPGGKVPITGNGYKNATIDLQQIRQWWQRSPQANIGLPTGHLFDVIDIDGPPGYASLADMRDAAALPPIIGKAYTAGSEDHPPGGRHLYVPVSGRGNGSNIAPGVDYRGKGGYVVAPPSRSAHTGRRWSWIDPLQLPSAEEPTRG